MEHAGLHLGHQSTLFGFHPRDGLLLLFGLGGVVGGLQKRKGERGEGVKELRNCWMKE